MQRKKPNKWQFDDKGNTNEHNHSGLPEKTVTHRSSIKQYIHINLHTDAMWPLGAIQLRKIHMHIGSNTGISQSQWLQGECPFIGNICQSNTLSKTHRKDNNTPRILISQHRYAEEVGGIASLKYQRGANSYHWVFKVPPITVTSRSKKKQCFKCEVILLRYIVHWEMTIKKKYLCQSMVKMHQNNMHEISSMSIQINRR